MLIVTLFLIFASMALLGVVVFPYVYEQMYLSGQRREREFFGGIEGYMTAQKAKNTSKVLAVLPLILGAVFFFIFPEEMRVAGIFIGVTGGYLLPSMYIKKIIARRKDMFDDQLVDGLMIMSSSFRGGLSLVQAVESIVEEMPSPISDEFAIVLGENKMGVALEDAMYHLYQRMPSISLQQMITSILLSRETGGNLPVIFSRIVVNIRERKKIQQNLAALTVQGKIQGVVMVLLPIAFAIIVFNSNKQIFINMINSDLGRAMLIYAFVSEVIGAVLIMKISSFKDF
ncbi:type II secretion system F family protein [Candidatus Omnitrophota bacterium]